MKKKTIFFMTKCKKKAACLKFRIRYISSKYMKARRNWKRISNTHSNIHTCTQKANEEHKKRERSEQATEKKWLKIAWFHGWIVKQSVLPSLNYWLSILVKATDKYRCPSIRWAVTQKLRDLIFSVAPSVLHRIRFFPFCTLKSLLVTAFGIHVWTL